MWVGFWVYECVQHCYPYENFMESVCRRSTSFKFNSLNPVGQMLQINAHWHTHWHPTMDILWLIVCLSSTYNHEHILCMYAERISDLNCRCNRWWFRVVYSPLTPTCIHSSCQQKALSFSVHLESHNTTQCSSLYTKAVTQYSHTPYQCSSTPLPIRDDASRQASVTLPWDINEIQSGFQLVW